MIIEMNVPCRQTPTNGQVIQTLFPEWIANRLKFHMGTNWWNTPYKEKKNEDSN